MPIALANSNSVFPLLRSKSFGSSLALPNLFQGNRDFTVLHALLHPHCIEESMVQSRCLINMCWLNQRTYKTEAMLFKKHSPLFEQGASHFHCVLCLTNYVLGFDYTGPLWCSCWSRLSYWNTTFLLGLANFFSYPSR